MRFMPQKWSRKLSPKHAKKLILGTLKTGTKLVGAGILMGAGTEIAQHISIKAQGVDEGFQYIMIEDLGPSFARFDSVDAITDRSKEPHWFPGTHNPLTFGLPVFFFILFLVILLRCGLKKFGCLSSLCRQWTPTQKPDSQPTPSNSSPPSCETLNMEAEMERLERGIHNLPKEPEENPYSTPNRHLKEVLKQVNESAINWAHAAHHSDTLHQR